MSSTSLPIDFTPGAQGVWKAFEREINLSVIQAARAARTVKMPDLFSLYDSQLQKDRGQVITEKGKKDINQLDWERKHTGHHRFLTLGDAWFTVDAMRNSSTETFNQVIIRCLGQPLPEDLMKTWKQIQQIRNLGSHINPLSQDDYEEVLREALASQTLQPLMKIKDILSRRL